ncbi:lysin A [Gordonia phage Skog]|uniref:Lysin A n=1 Tax=Gordonia phage Skog TaxID=2704033 RepID=A0A6G6XJY1_9CAUD|nr:endolysin [Gordonia phage Skog]QIG58155.1 lysin A [Gordonia phage Skog]
MAEKMLNYDRAIVPQETSWWCGPASIQIALNTRGIRVAERDIARKTEALEGNIGWDDQDGTDHIRQVTQVLNEYLPEADYVFVSTPNDPMSQSQKDHLWDSIVASIDAGYAVIFNIVAPPGNHPKAVAPSTVSPNYGRYTIFHYFPGTGYFDSANRRLRRVWIPDPGFSPHGFWLSFDQLATLIPPKGYTYATKKSVAAGPDPKVLGEILFQQIGAYSV